MSELTGAELLKRIIEAKPRMQNVRSSGFLNKDYDMGRISIDLPIIEAKKLMSAILIAAQREEV